MAGKVNQIGGTVKKINFGKCSKKSIFVKHFYLIDDKIELFIL